LSLLNNIITDQIKGNKQVPIIAYIKSKQQNRIANVNNKICKEGLNQSLGNNIANDLIKKEENILPCDNSEAYCKKMNKKKCISTNNPNSKSKQEEDEGNNYSRNNSENISRDKKANIVSQVHQPSSRKQSPKVVKKNNKVNAQGILKRNNANYLNLKSKQPTVDPVEEIPAKPKETPQIISKKVNINGALKGILQLEMEKFKRKYSPAIKIPTSNEHRKARQ